MRYLLKSGADARYRCEEDGTTPLHQAALLSDTTILEDLLAAGASVDDEDGEGATAMHYASQSMAVVTLVIAGADVDHEDHAGRTPGCRARERSNMGVVKQLLENHADLSKIQLTIGDGDDRGLVKQASQKLEQAHASTAAKLITPSATVGSSQTNLCNANAERKLIIGIVSTNHPRILIKMTDKSLARRSRMVKIRQLTP